MADDVVLEHPNRSKPASQLARVVVIALLLASAALLLIISIGGWKTFEGDRPIQLAFIAIYVLMALFVARWSRGVLPMAAGLAVFLAIFAALAAPGWFDRDKPGFTDPGLSSSVIGLLCTLLVAVQLAQIVAALIAFRQQWNVEVERPRRPASAEPAPA